jgi:1,4-alpha-glucan branching enzyme
MHDTLEYMRLDPIHRRYHHNQITFRAFYAFTENFVLPLSHDEVVHGKGSLLGKMAGDYWQKFAHLRALYGLMFAEPGKKLLFMGCEFGQWREWDHERGLDWHLLDHDSHAGLQRWVADLNRLLRLEPALHELDFEGAGFSWIDCADVEQSVVCFTREARRTGQTLLVACNFTPVPRHNYRIGVPFAGHWRELLNSDASSYGGSGLGNHGGVETSPVASHARPQSLELTLPPLAVCFFKQPAERGPSAPR